MTAGVILLVISQICRVSCSTYFIFPTFSSSFLFFPSIRTHSSKSVISFQVRSLFRLNGEIYRIYKIKSLEFMPGLPGALHNPSRQTPHSLSPFPAPFQMNSCAYVACMQIAYLLASHRGPEDRAKRLTSDLATTGGREQEASVLIHAGI